VEKLDSRQGQPPLQEGAYPGASPSSQSSAVPGQATEQASAGDAPSQSSATPAEEAAAAAPTASAVSANASQSRPAPEAGSHAEQLPAATSSGLGVGTKDREAAARQVPAQPVPASSGSRSVSFLPATASWATRRLPAQQQQQQQQMQTQQQPLPQHAASQHPGTAQSQQPLRVQPARQPAPQQPEAAAASQPARSVTAGAAPSAGSASSKADASSETTAAPGANLQVSQKSEVEPGAPRALQSATARASSKTESTPEQPAPPKVRRSASLSEASEPRPTSQLQPQPQPQPSTSSGGAVQLAAAEAPKQSWASMAKALTQDGAATFKSAHPKQAQSRPVPSAGPAGDRARQVRAFCLLGVSVSEVPAICCLKCFPHLAKAFVDCCTASIYHCGNDMHGPV
jgi:nicotinate-nucleotide--dimethylbenzimidazole phosphoribosyltransferase